MPQSENKSVNEREPDVHGSSSIQLQPTPTSIKDSRKKYQLFIDDALIKNVEVETGGQSTPDGIWFSLQISDADGFERLGKYTLRQLPPRLNEIMFFSTCIPLARSLEKVSFLASHEEEDLERKSLIGQVSFDLCHRSRIGSTFTLRQPTLRNYQRQLNQRRKSEPSGSMVEKLAVQMNSQSGSMYRLTKVLLNCFANAQSNLKKFIIRSSGNCQNVWAK